MAITAVPAITGTPSFLSESRACMEDPPNQIIPINNIIPNMTPIPITSDPSAKPKTSPSQHPYPSQDPATPTTSESYPPASVPNQDC